MTKRPWTLCIPLLALVAGCSATSSVSSDESQNYTNAYQGDDEKMMEEALNYAIGSLETDCTDKQQQTSIVEAKQHFQEAYQVDVQFSNLTPPAQKTCQEESANQHIEVILESLPKAETN